MSGEKYGVISSRGTFCLHVDGKVRAAKDQYPLVLADVYAGDPLTTELIHQGDLIPFKPGTDITFLGHSWAPGQRPLKSWTCSLSVGSIQKTLRVHGERSWQLDRTTNKINSDRQRDKTSYRWPNWIMGEPTPTLSTPLSWTLAHGGPIPQTEQQDHNELPKLHDYNPIGLGLISNKTPSDISHIPAPRIEGIDTPITDWRSPAQPDGFAPIPPFWRQRQQYAGSYDNAWLEERHPLLPLDFDARFWQCAPPGLIAEPWLKGGEPFELHNLFPDHEIVRGHLPSFGPRARLPNGRGLDLALDGVHFDMRPDMGFLFLTWRAGFPWPDQRGTPELHIREDF